MSVNQIQLRGYRTRALEILFHKINNDLMTINGFEPSRGILSLLKRLFRRQRPIFVLSAKENWNWNRPPLPFLDHISSSAILLLQIFSPTTYRPPLPSRLLTHYLKPSKVTTGKIYLLPKSTILYCARVIQ